MSIEKKSKEALIAEIKSLRKRVQELERPEVTREKLQDILRDSEQSYKRLVQYLTDYIYTVFIKDDAAVYTYHGPGCVAVTGYNSKDYADDPGLWFEMVYEEDRERVREFTRKALAGEPVPSFEHRIRHRNGSIRWIKNTIVLHKNEAGTVVSYDGLINDITELKAAEEEKKLHQQQLIQTDKMASLGVLVAGVAHEVNNPNNYILLNAQFLSDVWKSALPILDEYFEQNGDFSLGGIPFSEARQNISDSFDGIIDGAGRIEKIVRGLKTFSRRDKGDFNQEININSVVKSAVLLSNNLIQKSTAHFNIDLCENLPLYEGNRQQMEQVMINLLTNACHAIDHRDKRIGVTTSFDEKKQRIIIDVYDEGVGIPEENINRVIDPFFTTKRNQEGTGLGLTISYQIIKNHGGSLVFDSEDGKGTRVSIKLPI